MRLNRRSVRIQCAPTNLEFKPPLLVSKQLQWILPGVFPISIFFNDGYLLP